MGLLSFVLLHNIAKQVLENPQPSFKVVICAN